jgi:hypothetical protein
LTANIHTGAARVLWPGVLDAAQAGNANLICYPGGRLHTAEDFEAERNVIYQLVDTERLDGLVSWTSALAGTVTTEEVIYFHQRYRPLIVSLASPGPRLIGIDDGYQACAPWFSIWSTFTAIAAWRLFVDQKATRMPWSDITPTWMRSKKGDYHLTRPSSRPMRVGKKARRPCESCWMNAN